MRSRRTFGRRVSSQDDFQSPNPEIVRSVDLQCFNGRMANRSNTLQYHAGPFEMIRPPIPAWMEERHHFAADLIENFLFVPLAQRTRHASQGQVLQHGWSAASLWLNVIEMEGRRLSFLGESTILAAVVGAPNDIPSKLRQ